MGKGRYLKAAERACATKARFDTAQEAERIAEYRFRAYRCPVCHSFHLTSTAGPATAQAVEPKPPAAEPGPKLGDLDWSPILDPQPKPVKKPVVKPAPVNPPPPRGIRARCAAKPSRDGRVLLVVDGRLVKSARITISGLPGRLDAGVWVMVEGDPPRIVRLADPE